MFCAGELAVRCGDRTRQGVQTGGRNQNRPITPLQKRWTGGVPGHLPKTLTSSQPDRVRDPASTHLRPRRCSNPSRMHASVPPKTLRRAPYPLT